MRLTKLLGGKHQEQGTQARKMIFPFRALLFECNHSSYFSACLPVVEGRARDHQGGNVEAVAFEVPGQAQLVRFLLGRHAVVAHQREGEHQDLALVGRVGQRFWVAHHAGVEDHLNERRKHEKEVKESRNAEAKKKGEVTILKGTPSFPHPGETKKEE